uniref:Uncharacterized protein n=1 Tax=Anguilla anguilla TaxID=7936 RepID=A0A0E9T0J7_ANGAN
MARYAVSVFVSPRLKIWRFCYLYDKETSYTMLRRKSG